MSPRQSRTRGASRLDDSLLAALLAPLDELRDQYEEALATIGTLVADLAALRTRTAGAGSPASGSNPGPRWHPPVDDQFDAPEIETSRPVVGQVDGGSFERLLDLQQRMSELQGVASVAVTGVESGRATLLIDLEQSPSMRSESLDFRSSEPTEVPPTLVCTWCDAILSVGGPQVSHGLCAACAQPFNLINDVTVSPFGLVDGLVAKDH